MVLCEKYIIFASSKKKIDFIQQAEVKNDENIPPFKLLVRDKVSYKSNFIVPIGNDRGDIDQFGILLTLFLKIFDHLNYFPIYLQLVLFCCRPFFFEFL